MPNYIQMIDKTTGEAENFNTIDEKLCAALEVPCDTSKYFARWYDTIGYSGCDSLQGVIKKATKWDDDNLNRALAWLDEHYTLDAWCSR